MKHVQHLNFDDPVYQSDGSIKKLSDLGGEYTLPIASNDTLGGVKIGDGLEIEEDGTLSVSGGGGSEIVIADNIPSPIVSTGTVYIENTVLEVGSKYRFYATFKGNFIKTYDALVTRVGNGSSATCSSYSKSSSWTLDAFIVVEDDRLLITYDNPITNYIYKITKVG